MKLPESARLQIDLAFKRYKTEILEGEVTTKWYHNPDRKAGYDEHCHIDICVDGDRLPLILTATVFGKTQLNRAPRLAKAMLSEIKNRKSKCV